MRFLCRHIHLIPTPARLFREKEEAVRMVKKSVEQANQYKARLDHISEKMHRLRQRDSPDSSKVTALLIL